MIIRKEDLKLGSTVSIDQYISSTLSRLSNTKGKEPTKDKHNGGTIMVDHSSTHIQLFSQVSLSTDETL